MAGAPIGSEAELALPAEPTSPARARDFVTRTVEAWQVTSRIETLVLLTSELVTNALLHARTAMTVQVRLEPSSIIRLAVVDGSPQLPRRRDFSIDAGTGRGLRLVATLVQDWGVELRGSGKTVWCRVSLDSDNGDLEHFDFDAVDAL